MHVSASVSLPYPQHLNLSKCDVPITEYLLLFSVGDAHSYSSPSTPVYPHCRVQKKLKGLVSSLNLWQFSLPTLGATMSLCHLQAEGCCHCTQSQGQSHCSSLDFHTTQGDQNQGNECKKYQCSAFTVQTSSLIPTLQRIPSVLLLSSLLTGLVLAFMTD